MHFPVQLGGGGWVVGGGGWGTHGVWSVSHSSAVPDGVAQGQFTVQSLDTLRHEPNKTIQSHPLVQGAAGVFGSPVVVVLQSGVVVGSSVVVGSVVVVEVGAAVVVHGVSGATSPVVQLVCVQSPSSVPQNSGYVHLHSGAGVVVVGSLVVEVVVVATAGQIHGFPVVVVLVGSDVVVVVVL